jgi:hypothetical protein
MRFVAERGGEPAIGRGAAHRRYRVIRTLPGEIPSGSAVSLAEKPTVIRNLRISCCRQVLRLDAQAPTK